MAYNKDQWISSFEDRLSLLRPHLTPRVLTSIGLTAWHSQGRNDEDPIKAAEAYSEAMDSPGQTKQGPRRPIGPK